MTEPAETHDPPPITVGDIIQRAKAAAPGSIIVGGYRITYVDEYSLAEWTAYDPDSHRD